jgi:hypothetical protein
VRALVLPLACLVLAACECDHATRAPLDQRQDVATLQAALTEDPAQLVLDEIDDAIARQRPVIAADLIEDAAIPAVRRHIRALQDLEMHTRQGQTLRTRASRLMRARVTALEHWRDALARGIGHDDEVLLDALHENAEAERAIAEFHSELAAIRPPETGAAPATDRGAILEGLPSLEPPATDGDDTDTPAEPDPHGADPIDGTEDTTEPPAVPGDGVDHHATGP